jgi:hypothetical protein
MTYESRSCRVITFSITSSLKMDVSATFGDFSGNGPSHPGQSNFVPAFQSFVIFNM